MFAAKDYWQKAEKLTKKDNLTTFVAAIQSPIY